MDDRIDPREPHGDGCDWAEYEAYLSGELEADRFAHANAVLNWDGDRQQDHHHSIICPKGV